MGLSFDSVSAQGQKSGIKQIEKKLVQKTIKKQVMKKEKKSSALRMKKNVAKKQFPFAAVKPEKFKETPIRKIDEKKPMPLQDINASTRMLNESSTAKSAPAGMPAAESLPSAESLSVQAPVPAAPAAALPQPTVEYSGFAFSPQTLSVSLGSIVVFKNKGSSSMWVASATHPTHHIYPEFDQKSSAGPGGEYSFAFAKKGSWKFHDHLNPGAVGEIVVE